MKKGKIYVVTKFFKENGIELQKQYSVSSTSKKKAMEEILEIEKIIVDEK